MLHIKKVMDLHLFDGAAAPAGAGEGSQQAEGQGPANPTGRESLKNVVYGKDPQGQQVEPAQQSAGSQAPFAGSSEEGTEPDPAQVFEEMIKGQYKDQFQSKVQSILDKRFKSMNDQKAQIDAYKGVIDPLMEIYGIKDMQDLRKAILKDNGKVEQLADEAGMSVDQYLAYQETMRQNAQYQAAEQERIAQEESDKIYQDWMQQAQELKTDYPNFDLEAEVENPAFLDLIKNPNIDIRTAYEALHLPEIMQGTASHVAEAVRQNTVNTIRARGMRPAENGLAEQPGIVRKTDTSKLSKADRAEIARRVARGETITF